MRALGSALLRWLAALAGVAAGGAVVAGVYVSLGYDSGLASWIAIFCAVAWIVVGLPLAVLNPGFRTRAAVLRAVLLSGIGGSLLVFVAFRASMQLGTAVFAAGAFAAAAIAMAVYTGLVTICGAAGGTARGAALALVLLPGAAIAGVVAIPVGFLAAPRLLQRTTTVTRIMTWAPAPDRPDGVVLRYADSPGYFVEINSPELRERLRGRSRIPVEFEVRKSLTGRLIGYSILKIDGAPWQPGPDPGSSHAGSSGNAGPHPLER